MKMKVAYLIMFLFIWSECTDYTDRCLKKKHSLPSISLLFVFSFVLFHIFKIVPLLKSINFEFIGYSMRTEISI